MSRGKYIRPEQAKQIAAHAAEHLTKQTADAFSVSIGTVCRVMARGRDGEFGEEIARALNERPPGKAMAKRKKGARMAASTDPERLAEVAAYAVAHTWEETCEALGVSPSTVSRAVKLGRAGEFGDQVAHGLNLRLKRRPKAKGKAKAKTKTKAKASAQPKRLPPRGTDLEAMVALMLEKAKHHEALAAKLRAAAAALDE